MTAVTADAAAAGQGTDPWEAVAGRVDDYLRALGIRDALHLERIASRVRQRFEARAATARLENPVEAAIEEACDLLDKWLSAELGIVGDRDALFSARAALLSGAVPGWAARFAGVSESSCAAAIRCVTVAPLPEDAPLTMVPNTIELFWRRMGNMIKRSWRYVGRVIAAGLRRLIGWLPADAGDAHSGPPR